MEVWSGPSVAVSLATEVKPTAVRPPSGVRKNRAVQPAGPDRTGTKRSPAGKGSEGSGSSEYSTGDMVLLLAEGDVRRPVRIGRALR